MQARMQWRKREHIIQSKGRAANLPPSWDPETREFPTYEVRLPGWSAPPLVGWNRNYPLAQTVFAPNAQGATIRKGLAKESKALFGGDLQVLSDGEAFLKWIHGGVRNGKRQVYAFAVTRDGLWRFVEAACMVAHASMAAGIEEVAFAGEFHVAERDGEPELILDNNSGTYAPKGALLPGVCALLSKHLSGLRVAFKEHADPELAKSKATYKGEIVTPTPGPAGFPGVRPGAVRRTPPSTPPCTPPSTPPMQHRGLGPAPTARLPGTPPMLSGHKRSSLSGSQARLPGTPVPAGHMRCLSAPGFVGPGGYAPPGWVPFGC